MAIHQVFYDDKDNKLKIQKGQKLIAIPTAYNLTDILHNGGDAGGIGMYNSSLNIMDNGHITMRGRDGKTWVAVLNNGAWEITEND